MRILITDTVAEVCSTYLVEKGLTVDSRPGLSSQELANLIEDYQGLIVRSATKVTADIIAKAKILKVIGRAGAGVDNIDVDAASEHGIAVVNAADGNTISAAEFTFALILAAARHIPFSHVSVKQGKWERNLFKGSELYHKALGVIGLGKIGQEVAKRALAFEMRVLAYDPLIDLNIFQKTGVEQKEIGEIFNLSDFVSVHVPLNQETKGLINSQHFQNCKEGMRLINASRGGVVDETALYNALVQGKVAGAAIDVYEKEPPGENPLLGLKNVISTPHLGASTFEAQQRVAGQIAEQVASFLLTGTAQNIVNPAVLAA